MTQYKAIIGALVDSGAKGMVANLGNMIETPFFQVVTQQIAAVSFPLSAEEAAQLNIAYQLQGHPNVAFAEGSANRLLIETHDGQIRQFRPGKDRICLTLALDGQTGLIGTQPIMACGQQVGQGQGMGIANFAQLVDTPFGQVPAAYPIPNRYVLDEDELALAESTLQAYNAAIAGVVAEYEASLGLVDIYATFEAVRTKGVLGQGGRVLMTATLTPGGAFSADGIHPNPKGQAWLANVFAQAINARFGSNLQGYDLTQFRGNDFPQ
jgi:hypothetical protein